jgi:hypothetical protein
LQSGSIETGLLLCPRAKEQSKLPALELAAREATGKQKNQNFHKLWLINNVKF